VSAFSCTCHCTGSRFLDIDIKHCLFFSFCRVSPLGISFFLFLLLLLLLLVCACNRTKYAFGLICLCVVVQQRRRVAGRMQRARQQSQLSGKRVDSQSVRYLMTCCSWYEGVTQLISLIYLYADPPFTSCSLLASLVYVTQRTYAFTFYRLCNSL